MLQNGKYCNQFIINLLVLSKTLKTNYSNWTETETKCWENPQLDKFQLVAYTETRFHNSAEDLQSAFFVDVGKIRRKNDSRSDHSPFTGPHPETVLNLNFSFLIKKIPGRQWNKYHANRTITRHNLCSQITYQFAQKTTEIPSESCQIP